MKSEIAVLIPHYNDPDGLEASLLSIKESIAIDVVVVDDGSHNKPKIERLKEVYRSGEIALIEQGQNKGIEHTLNRGLDEIQRMGYPLIGRLDCGDLCYEGRFQKQIEHLHQHKDVHLLGTWVNHVDKEGNYLFTHKTPVTHKELKKKMYLNSMFVHPTVVYRSSVLETVGMYPTEYKSAEDYAFFFKILKHFRSENYPEVLLDYIIDPNSISSTKRTQQVKSRIRVILKYFYPGIYPIYGLFRNILLLFVTRRFTTSLKKWIGKG